MCQNALNQREFSVHNEMQWPIFRKSRAPRQNSWVFHGGAQGLCRFPWCLHGARHVHKFRGSSSTQSQKPWSCWEKVVAVHPTFSWRIFGLPLYASWVEWILASDWTGYRRESGRLRLWIGVIYKHPWSAKPNNQRCVPQAKSNARQEDFSTSTYTTVVADDRLVEMMFSMSLKHTKKLERTQHTQFVN